MLINRRRREGLRTGFHLGAAVLGLGLLFARPAVATEYDVYILAGQSNMDGRGRVKDLVGPLLPFAGVQQDAIIWYSNSSLRGPAVQSNGWQPLQPGFSVAPGPPARPPATGAANAPATTRPTPQQRTVPSITFGPEVGFAKTIAGVAAASGHKIAIIKFAVGGTNLRNEWNPKTPKKIYAEFIPYAHQGLAELTKNGDTINLRALLWHQGESDIALTPQQYEKYLTDLIASVRRDFDSPSLPIYLGETFDNGQRMSIHVAQLAASQKLADVYVVGSGNLVTSDKGTHFDAASQIELGRRFAMAVMTRSSILPTTMPATTQP